MSDGQRPIDAAAETVQRGITAATAYGRADLADHLQDVATKLASPGVSVLVIGEFKQGKSTLVNALLNVDHCPVDDDIATAIPTVTSYGDQTLARAHWDLQDQPPDERASLPADVDIANRTEEHGDHTSVAMDEVESLVTAPPADDGRRLRTIEVAVPRRLLQNGLSLVDTPGIGGIESAHAEASLGTLATAHAAVFVSDASQELTRSELDLIRRGTELTDHAVLALTKTDLYREWPKIRDLNAGHLSDAGIEIDIVPMSAVQRRRAVAANDAELNRRSGYPTLADYLRATVVADAEARAVVSAGAAVTRVVEQLTAVFESERAVLVDPSTIEGARVTLQEASDRAAAVRSGAARWQTALNDGVQDLNGDIDHDLRSRFREINKQVEERLDDEDPAQVWDEFEPWLRRVAAEAVASNYRLLHERAEQLARAVGELFMLDEQASLIDLDLPAPTDFIGTVDIDADDPTTAPGAVSQALGALRGSYGGMMMFGMLGTVVGITMILPVTLGLGAVMGAKQIRDDRGRALTQRRQQARQVARTFVDEVSFAVSKESRDLLRRVHRDLRDTYAERAQELVASAQSALDAANRASTADESTRTARLADVEAELARLAALADRAARLDGKHDGDRHDR
ncbi:MAG: dynamin family protein [Actinomycetota bacterium]